MKYLPLLLLLFCGCDNTGCEQGGHAWGNWALKEEFANTPSMQIRHCRVCGFAQQQPIAQHTNAPVEKTP